MSLESKYLKYKNKYLNLKNQLGGTIDEIHMFFHYLQSRTDLLSPVQLEQIKHEIRRIPQELDDMSVDEFARMCTQLVNIDWYSLVRLFQQQSGIRPVPRQRQAAAAGPLPYQAAAAGPLPYQAAAAGPLRVKNTNVEVLSPELEALRIERRAQAQIDEERYRRNTETARARHELNPSNELQRSRGDLHARYAETPIAINASNRALTISISSLSVTVLINDNTLHIYCMRGGPPMLFNLDVSLLFDDALPNPYLRHFREEIIRILNEAIQHIQNTNLSYIGITDLNKPRILRYLAQLLRYIRTTD